MRTYLEWMVELPGTKKVEDNLDLKAAMKVLNEDHYDLEKVKNASSNTSPCESSKEKMKGPILCFVGPPGVGKTSLGEIHRPCIGPGVRPHQPRRRPR